MRYWKTSKKTINTKGKEVEVHSSPVLRLETLPNKKEEEVEDKIKTNINKAIHSTHDMMLPSMVPAIFCFLQGLIEKKDMDIGKSPNYENINNITSAWELTLPRRKRDEKSVVSNKKRNTYLNIDVTVSKWMLEVKVDMKVVSV